MKVLSCTVRLMALGFTQISKWKWEHSAIMLSLSLLFLIIAELESSSMPFVSLHGRWFSCRYL